MRLTYRATAGSRAARLRAESNGPRSRALVVLSAMLLAAGTSAPAQAQVGPTAPLPGIALAAATSTPTAAQPPKKTPASDTPMALYMATGQVRGFFFRATGEPVPGVRVWRGTEALAVSDAEGMVVLQLDAGEVALEFQLSRRRRLKAKVPVLHGQETEFIVTLPSSGDPVVDIEAPESGLAIDPTATATATGVVQGTVVSEADGKVVQGARVFVRGTGVDARSDAKGRFELSLPAGTRELTIIHPSFSTRTVTGVEVVADDVVEVRVTLEKKSLQLAEMVITAPRIEGSAISVLEERKDSSNVQDVLGADQISKSGDTDAASALSRVTGITVVGGRYIYVRGLGERYSSTLMNDSSLPSPDPERRVVPLDLFPASAIAGLVVQKSYSADIPGEFGGGLVQIRTKDIPEDFTLSLSLSGAYDTFATFEDGLVYDGGGSDWLGFGAGSRALPSDFAELAKERRIQPFVPIIAEDGFTSAERERLAEMLDPNYATRTRTLPPNFGLSTQVGGKFELFGKKAGAYLAGDYGNTWTRQDLQFRTFNVDSGELVLRKNQRILNATNEISLSGLGALGVDFDDDNQVRLTLGVFRISSNTANETTGFDDDRGVDVLKSRLTWSERMVSTNQLRGTNLLSADLGLKLDWRYQLAVATRDQPNRRSLRYTEELTGGFRLDPDGTERFYSDLLDINHDLGADFVLPWKLVGALESEFKAGFAAELKSRDVNVRRFTYKRPGIRGGEETERVEFLPRDRIFQPDTIEPGLQELEESTRSDDNYRGSQQIVAGYLLGDLDLLDALTVQAGLRVEFSNQKIESKPLPGSDTIAFDPASLTTVDVMPALTATWAFIEDMQLRGGLARTVNRPSFRELSPAAFIDLARARENRGNPDLDRATILHADLRWEWYPSAGESVSVAAFGKLFDKPIEYTLSGGANQVARPINTERARVLGLEFEARKNFGFFGDFFSDFYVAGNLTLVSSQVTIGDIETILTSTERPLQGQSPYVVNAQLGYDNVDWGTSAVVQFNVFGRRINDVGVDGLPDIYEEPRPLLDVVIKQRWDRFKFSLKAKNLLNAQSRLTQTDLGGAVVNNESFPNNLVISLGVGVDLY